MRPDPDATMPDPDADLSTDLDPGDVAPVYLSDFDRRRVLHYASDIVHRQLVGAAPAVLDMAVRPLMAWLAEATSQADSDQRIEALARQWSNLQKSDQPRGWAVGDLLTNARHYYEFLAAGLRTPAIRAAIMKALTDPDAGTVAARAYLFDDTWLCRQIADRLTRALMYDNWSRHNAEVIVTDVHDEASQRSNEAGGIEWSVSPATVENLVDRIDEQLAAATGRHLAEPFNWCVEEAAEPAQGKSGVEALPSLEPPHDNDQDAARAAAAAATQRIGLRERIAAHLRRQQPATNYQPPKSTDTPREIH